MNDSQTWTIIIGLMAMLVAAMSFAFQLMNRTFVAELRAGFSGVDAKIEILSSKVDAQGRRLDGLDADVQVIIRRLLDGPDAA